MTDIRAFRLKSCLMPFLRMLTTVRNSKAWSALKFLGFPRILSMLAPYWPTEDASLTWPFLTRISSVESFPWLPSASFWVSSKTSSPHCIILSHFVHMQDLMCRSFMIFFFLLSRCGIYYTYGWMNFLWSCFPIFGCLFSPGVFTIYIEVTVFPSVKSLMDCFEQHQIRLNLNTKPYSFIYIPLPSYYIGIWQHLSS